MKTLPMISTAILISGVAFADAAHGELHDSIFTGDVKPVIYVSDVEKSAPFYTDILGFGFDGFSGVEADPYYAEMLAGPLKFGLHEPTLEGDQERVGRQRLYFRVTDIESLRLRVEANGAEPGKIIRRAWMDFFAVRDPDGNEIIFAVTDPVRHQRGVWKRNE